MSIKTKIKQLLCTHKYIITKRNLGADLYNFTYNNGHGSTPIEYTCKKCGKIKKEISHE